MAKVLSCPDCGHKHKLDLLLGLDFFMCQSCGKKLAVPAEVSNVNQESPKKEKVISVVASSTLSPDAGVTVIPVTPSSNNFKDDILPEHLPKGEIDSIKPNEIKPNVDPSQGMECGKHLHLPHGHIAQMGFSVFVKLIIWGLSIGIGFICIVIVPRLFGLGFHAIDFVDVITQNGILKYKVVVYLIFLWSIATALFVGIFNYLFIKLKRSK